jgi:hypothetical protein
MADHELLLCRRNGTHVLYSQNASEFNRKLSSHIVRELMSEMNQDP